MRPRREDAPPAATPIADAPADPSAALGSLLRARSDLLSVLDDLAPNERAVLRRRFGLDGEAAGDAGGHRPAHGPQPRAHPPDRGQRAPQAPRPAGRARESTRPIFSDPTEGTP